ncbi:4-hydroxy-tetrahydrodipicolinate reductase [Thermocrinis minervae]|uniref:4-hydroxy-tetrahydrodipicolinate reductase n=1 Tax=Thermocrinis minervae TaxID=381751 RepID=A0A1M6QJV7_9AQUI|nr:4-hydroxy-tetrahydrodipicolinate reductase [Thermocrinis minervae]SHK20559.1 dihydrodipicolinate reductase [Thermocrinis minervae]
MIKVVICGALGRMGRAILQTALHDASLKIVAGVEHPDCVVSPDLGKAVNIKDYEGVPLTSRLEEVLPMCHVVIEFSGNTEAALGHAKLCAEAGKPIVIGTTGFTEDEVNQLKELSEKTAVLLSPNMSLGVNLLFRLVQIATQSLKGKGFDVEIVEIHHRFKKDAPSGTALKLYEVVNQQLDETRRISCRDGISPRKEDEVGVFAIRGGDVVGDHTVYFLGFGERLELTHRATSRETFARGALEAAKWIHDKEKGFYNMFDVLGL